MTSSGTYIFSMSDVDILVSRGANRDVRNRAIVSNGTSFNGEQLRKFLIYAAINKANGKAYVGFTSKSLRTRVLNHLRHAKAGSTQVFHRAIRKYGDESFCFFVIAHYDNYEAAMRAEVHDIETLRPEYNMTAGGEGAVGRKHSEETKAKMSVAARARAGRPITERQLAAALAMQMKGQSARRKKVFCEQNGEVYESISAAAKAFGLCSNQVSHSCMGVRHPRGIRFKYVVN